MREKPESHSRYSSTNQSSLKARPNLCHPERSRGICGAPLGPPEFSVTNPNPQTELSSRPERTRISCHAALDETTSAPFRKEGAHGVRQRHRVPQEIRGSVVEGPAVRSSSNHFPWKRCPSLCHPERSRGICSSADLPWKCFSRSGEGDEGPTPP
jgi:hypothetical protein